MDFIVRLERCAAEGLLPRDVVDVLEKFYDSYAEAVTSNGHAIEEYLPTLNAFVDHVIEVLREPPAFEPFHAQVKEPVDYYRFGLDMIRPLVIFESSKAFHLERADEMERQLAEGDNVVLLANHQTEPDPQAISLLLEKTHPKMAEEMIFVAGHRVTTDPLAIPFSLGRNLICIYSKKHIENPPEQKMEKLHHNQRAMRRLGQLFTEGGKCIYVAPSGGRDRPDADGHVHVAPFDSQSIEMLWLLAQQSGKPVHFYPLSLYTYPLLPPPHLVEVKLGERRHAQCTPIHLSFGEEVDMDNFPGADGLPKKEKREARAAYIWEQVRSGYERLEQG